MRDEKGRFMKGHTGYKPWLGKTIDPRVAKAVTASNKRRSGSNSSMWKGGKLLHQGRYYLIFQPTHPFADDKGYVREHRLVMEQKLGRYLSESEVVHHIDHNGLNNKIENLTLVTTQSEHIIIYHGKHAISL